MTEYYYDDVGELLLIVTTPDGRMTNYSYTSNGLPFELTSIIYPDGTQEFFEYNGDARLSNNYLNSGEESILYSYDMANKTTHITDAEGNTAKIHVDEFGQITWSENPLGAIIHYEYDEEFNLIRATDPSGNIYNFSYYMIS